MIRKRQGVLSFAVSILVVAVLVASAFPQNVIYKPYIQPGDNGPFGSKDQMLVAWQTDEHSPNTSAYSVEFGKSPSYGQSVTPQARVVDNYLAADPVLAAIKLPATSEQRGPSSNYSAVLSHLEYDTTYFYRVNGPGMPAGGFTASFHTRKRADDFSFLVQGDEGFFPVTANPALRADYEARIVHLMYNVENLSVPGAPQLPKPDLALNTGDNVYNNGAEGSYRDFWFPVWNSDVDSNEAGAPFIRSIPFYIVVGNHDIGATGVNVDMLASDSAGPYSGNTDGGDALAYFNNYYFPLNGPTGVDPQFTLNGDTPPTANGMVFSFEGTIYHSPAAIAAYKASTRTDSGKGLKQQIDHESNYSFDYGSAHYVFLDANPHLFNGILDGNAPFAAPQPTFPSYPSILRNWLIDDLDSSSQQWKFVVFHQPAFSSGNATVTNNQMRAIAKFLEDHGVNMVFNGHEHNYQRTYPIRANAKVAAGPSPTGPPAVSIDTSFDGVAQTIPDGVLYIVEGAGGNRDFDGDLTPARGSGTGIDQEDSATGMGSVSTFMFPNGPASWLDTNLTDNEMSPVLPGAGNGPKITTRFKAKLFSFADLVVRDNKLTLYQISEPLLPTSSATPNNPAPFGTDVNGNPVNDPIPDTVFDPTTGKVISPPAVGPSVLLDRFTVTKPDVDDKLHVSLHAPDSVPSGAQFAYRLTADNRSPYNLNGTQAIFNLPEGVSFVDSPDGSAAQINNSTIVVSIGRLAAGTSKEIHLTVAVSGDPDGDHNLTATALVRSGTALPVQADEVRTRVTSHGSDHDRD